MAYDMLHAINNGKDTWKVKVRVIRLWDAINLNSNELISLDMILLDEQGTMIHAKVMKHMVNKFRPLIQEGLVYMIANFKVTSAMNFRPVEGDKIINFLHTTKIQEIKVLKNIRIAEQSFMFCSVEVLSTRDGQKMYLSDVIGVASYIGNIEETETTHGITKIRDIVLRIEDQKVNIRLWGNKVNQIDEDSTGRVVIVTSTTVRKLKEYSLSSTGATKVYIDLDIPETAELQTRYCLEDDIIEEIEPEAHLQGTIQEQMLYNRKTLREITEIAYESEKQEKFYTAEATIKSINTSDEWYYIGCGKCNKKLQKEGNHFYCPKCEKEPEKTCPRYKLKLEICDLTATTTCTMFETEAKKLIKQSARFLIDRDDCDIHEQAEKLQKICGQRLIFQFRLNDYNFKYGYQDYTVYRIFFIDSEEDSSVQHADVEQNPTKGTKKARTRNTCRVVHSDEESEEDSQEQDQCKFKESSPKRKRTISIIEDGDSEKDGTENYSKTSIRLTGVDKGSKKKGIQNDNHEQVNKLSLSKTIKQESDDDEPIIGQTKSGRRRKSSPRRKRVVTRKCAGVDNNPENNLHEEKSEKEGTQEHNDSRPRTRLSCVDKKSLNKGVQKSGVLRTRKTSR